MIPFSELTLDELKEYAKGIERLRENSITEENRQHAANLFYINRQYDKIVEDVREEVERRTEPGFPISG